MRLTTLTSNPGTSGPIFYRSQRSVSNSTSGNPSLAIGSFAMVLGLNLKSILLLKLLVEKAIFWTVRFREISRPQFSGKFIKRIGWFQLARIPFILETKRFCIDNIDIGNCNATLLARLSGSRIHSDKIIPPLPLERLEISETISTYSLGRNAGDPSTPLFR